VRVLLSAVRVGEGWASVCSVCVLCVGWLSLRRGSVELCAVCDDRGTSRLRLQAGGLVAREVGGAGGGLRLYLGLGVGGSASGSDVVRPVVCPRWV